MAFDWYAICDEGRGMNEYAERARFEEWAISPPREWDIYKYGNGAENSWPGQYLNYFVQCAWEGWQAALGGEK